MPREEFRRRIQIPLPTIPEIEARLHEVLSPALLAPRRLSEQSLHLRNRILTLPVMAAIVLSLVWRHLTSLNEVLRLLAQEGLLWTEAIKVSQQALSKRLVTLPASLFETAFGEAMAASHRARQDRARPWPPVLEPLRERFWWTWLPICRSTGITILMLTPMRRRSRISGWPGCPWEACWCLTWACSAFHCLMPSPMRANTSSPVCGPRHATARWRVWAVESGGGTTS